MKTRTFNSLTLIAFALTMMAFAVSSCSTREKGKNIGLQLYSIRDSIKKDVPGSIRKVAGMGYRFVEPAGYAGGKFYNLSPEEFKALCLKNGMNVLSSHTGRPARLPKTGMLPWRGGILALPLIWQWEQNISYSRRWEGMPTKALKE